jgi:predicted ATPase
MRGAEPEGPLLGREAELAQLRAGIRRVVEEQQHAVLLVSGPPGIGKTRLRREIEAHLTSLEEPAIVLGARAEPLRRESAVALIAAALRSHPALEGVLQEGPAVDEATLEARRAAIAQLAGEAIEGAEQAREHAEFLGELLGVPMPETPALRAARADPIGCRR